MLDFEKKEWTAACCRYGQSLLDDYTLLYERLQHAELQVKTHGALVAAPNGFPAKNPWLAVAEKARAEMRVIEKMVFSPTGPAKLGKKEQKQQEAAEAHDSGVFRPEKPPIRLVKQR